MSKESQLSAMANGAISGDIFRNFKAFLGNGTAISFKFKTSGTGDVQQLAQGVNYIKASITIRADDSNAGTVYVGTGGVPVFPLSASQSITLDWCNPYESGLCIKDDGANIGTVYVIG